MIKANEYKVVIIGYPASGKSTLTNELEKVYSDYTIYRDIDFTKNGYVDGLYELRNKIATDAKEKFIVEGVMGYRFLRKGAQLKDFEADLIIHVKCSERKREIRYRKREYSKYKHLKGLHSGLDNIWAEFMSIKKYSPRIIEYYT
jgi:adenylate kinase family enzyme